MRIINKKLLENTAMGICVAGALYISGSAVRDVIEYDKKYINNVSKKKKEKDPSRYLKIVDNITAGKLHNTPKNWENELQLMRDSLRIDSLCKKAYFEGAQMVRDSIKNTLKVIK